MRKVIASFAGLFVAASLLAGEVSRVEPLSWWVGMKTDLQLLVGGEGIGAYTASIEGGKGIKASAVQSGKTLHFLPEKNTYGYFRYDGKEVVFVFINNSEEEVNVPWTRFSEISASLREGTNVITGERMKVSDETKVAPKSTLVVDFR